MIQYLIIVLTYLLIFSPVNAALAADTYRDVDYSSTRIKEVTPGMWQDFYAEGRPFGKTTCYKNDFTDWVADSWTITEVGAGLQKLTDERNGVVGFSSDGTEDYGNNVQLGGSGDGETLGESWLPATGKNLWFETRVKTSDVTQHDFFVGLSIQDTAIIATPGADLIGFRKDDGDALLDATSASTASGATSSVGLATLVNDTYVTLGFKVTTLDKIEFYVNGILVATHTTSIPITEMKLSMAHLNGENSIKTFSVDYIVACQDR